MADLSPAAQAVLDAFLNVPVVSGDYSAYRRSQIAATLRAVADQLKAPEDLGLHGNSYWAGMSAAETRLRAIAAELEA